MLISNAACYVSLHVFSSGSVDFKNLSVSCWNACWVKFKVPNLFIFSTLPPVVSDLNVLLRLTVVRRALSVVNCTMCHMDVWFLRLRITRDLLYIMMPMTAIASRWLLILLSLTTAIVTHSMNSVGRRYPCVPKINADWWYIRSYALVLNSSCFLCSIQPPG